VAFFFISVNRYVYRSISIDGEIENVSGLFLFMQPRKKEKFDVWKTLFFRCFGKCSDPHAVGWLRIIAIPIFKGQAHSPLC
jgi:hypothetical protein